MDISFIRGPEIGREQHSLPADHYRLIRLLFNRNQNETLFVPIRTIQYLGIIDRAEVVFVDGQGPRLIELAWCEFQSSGRNDLRMPVTYTRVFYHTKGLELMPRLQQEFFNALKLLEQRQPKHVGGTVTELKRN